MGLPARRIVVDTHLKLARDLQPCHSAIQKDKLCLAPKNNHTYHLPTVMVGDAHQSKGDFPTLLLREDWVDTTL